MKQKLRLLKKDGAIFEDISASVQDKIYINNIKLPIEEGDVLEHVLPSGTVQNLIVKKVVLYHMDSSLDHYEVEYVAGNAKGISEDTDLKKRHRVELYHKYDFHPKIKEVSFNQFHDGYFKESIQNALVEVINEVKERAGNPTINRGGRQVELDGDSLMNRVFGCDNQEPLIKFNDLSNSLDRAEQRGIMNLYKGIVGIRAKKAHLNFIQNDPVKTIEYLSLASLLMRLLDEFADPR